jgi:hypothetical protein
LKNSYLETWQESGNHPESETVSNLAASSLEPHYSVQVLAELWRLDESTIRRIFEVAPGVLASATINGEAENANISR